MDTVLSLNGKTSEQISTKAAKEEQAEDTAGILHRQNKRKKRKKEVQPENGSTSF